MEIELTQAEKSLIEKLGNCYNDFIGILKVEGTEHPSDRQEFAEHIHILQRHVMARLARIKHPEIFRGSHVQEISDGKMH